LAEVLKGVELTERVAELEARPLTLTSTLALALTLTLTVTLTLTLTLTLTKARLAASSQNWSDLAPDLALPAAARTPATVEDGRLDRLASLPAAARLTEQISPVLQVGGS
jgi:hypothetical protein